MSIVERIVAKQVFLGTLLGVLLGCVALPSPAGAAVALTPERFAALDALYSSAVPFDRGEPSAKELAAARGACRALDSADPLLAAIRRSCRLDLRMMRSFDAFGGCRTGLGCLRTAREARMDMSESLGLARRTNAAIDAAQLMPACRRALRVSKADLRLGTRTRDFLMLFQRAAMTGSKTLFRRLDREAEAIEHEPGGNSSNARERKIFRRACTPPGVVPSAPVAPVSSGV